jgi:hypothetical protein
VALKDFIVAFFGWLVLMGRNGMSGSAPFRRSGARLFRAHRASSSTRQVSWSDLCSGELSGARTPICDPSRSAPTRFALKSQNE